jgi:hypothetical protein
MLAALNVAPLRRAKKLPRGTWSERYELSFPFQLKRARLHTRLLFHGPERRPAGEGLRALAGRGSEKQAKHMAQDKATNPTSDDRTPSNTTKAPVWLFVAGALALGAGAAMVGLPKLMPEHAWMVNSAARSGLTSAPLLVGGLLLVGLWSLARALRIELPPAPEKDDSSKLVLDQVAGDLIALREALHEMRVEFVYLKDGLKVLQGEADRSRSEAEQKEGAQEAIFRMAASVDQLGGRIEQRLMQVQAAAHDGIQEMQLSLQHVRLQVAELASRAPLPAPATEQDGDPYALLADVENEIEIASGFEPSVDDMDVVVEFEPEEPELVTDLGLLDDLDDLGSPYQRGLVQSGGLSAKLSRLRDLMTDPDVRRAIDTHSQRSQRS